MSLFRKSNGSNGNGHKPNGLAVLNGGATDHGDFIRLHNVVKTYKTGAGDVTVLKHMDLGFNRGEFVGVIGKSGSGKSTLINMITGIDRPTAGEVWVGDNPVHKLNEGQMAVWRGKNLGVVFQFFQLLPMLSLVENIMLPMDFCNTFPERQRKPRAMQLLEMVEMAEHANKLPTAISGGQQQRVAIARALANDPPVIVADEPTGNLDSKTAESVFAMFAKLVEHGKTIIMVTHDGSLAKRVSRTVLIADGEIVNEYVARALPTLSYDQMITATRHVTPWQHAPGATIIQQGSTGDQFFIVTRGKVEVLLHRPHGNDVVVTQFGPGQYFGEIEMLHGGARMASIRASELEPVELLALDRPTFSALLNDSEPTREALDRTAERRLAENLALQNQ
jgi:ABC-type lipoprotein export system ATPase subunit